MNATRFRKASGSQEPIFDGLDAATFEPPLGRVPSVLRHDVVLVFLHGHGHRVVNFSVIFVLHQHRRVDAFVELDVAALTVTQPRSDGEDTRGDSQNYY